MQSWVQSWRPLTNAFCDFSTPPVLKYCPCQEKVMPGHTKCCTCHTDLMLQNAANLRKSAPSPPNISDEHVSCTAPATENLSLQILFKCPRLAIVFGNATKSSCFAHFWHGAQSLAPATQNDASTSKSGAGMWCFVHFDFEMCFAPQRRALFRHLNFQKCSEPVSFLHVWLRNVLRAATACTFSTSQLPKVLPTRFLFFSLANVLRATQGRATFYLSSGQMAPHPPLQRAYFSTLRSHKSLEKHSVSRLSYLFARLDLLSSETFSDFPFLIIFLLLFSSLTLPISAFHLSILSEVWLLNFLQSHCIHISLVWGRLHIPRFASIFHIT